MTVFITSDWHFCHDKDFVWQKRGFSSVGEMNIELLKRFNSVVKPEDEVYFLGDAMLNDNETALGFISQMNGYKHWIWGNHDSPTRRELLAKIPNSKIEGLACVERINGFIFYMSHYPTLTTNYDDDKPLKSRVLNLAGHTHSTEMWDKNSPWTYNVAVDAHDCYPVAVEEIIGAYRKKVADSKN